MNKSTSSTNAAAIAAAAIICAAPLGLMASPAAAQSSSGSGSSAAPSSDSASQSAGGGTGTTPGTSKTVKPAPSSGSSADNSTDNNAGASQVQSQNTVTQPPSAASNGTNVDNTGGPPQEAGGTAGVGINTNGTTINPATGGPVGSGESSPPSANTLPPAGSGTATVTTGTAAPVTIPVSPNSGAAAVPTQGTSDNEVATGTIRAIVIRGNKNVTLDAIRAVLDQRIGDAFSPNAAEADRQSIEDMGYFGSVVESATPGTSPGDVIVTYTLVENPVVSRIVFTGNTVEATPKLLGVMMTKTGQVLNFTILTRDIQSIIGVYQAAGYRAAVSEDINLDPTTGVLTVPLIEAKVSSIVVTGNHNTKAFVVTRELKERVGQPYNEIQFRKDLTRVLNLGIFDSVGPADISTPSVGEVAIGIPVKEKQTGTVSVSVGYSTQQKIVGRAQLSQSNFRGRGETASIMWEVAGVDNQSSVDLSFGDPYIDKHHTGFSIDLYNQAVFRFSSTFVDTSTSGSTAEYYERHVGGTLTFSRPVTEQSTAFLTGRTESVRSDNVSLPTTASFIRQDDDITGLGGRYVINTRDLESAPAAGGYNSISFEGVTSSESTIGGAPTPLAPGIHDFPKLGLDLRRYISLQGPRRKSITEPKRVLAFRLLAGFTASQIPFSEEYFLGGPDSLRGYEDSRFWGNNLLLLNTELRIPIAASLTTFIFTDAGDAWGSIYQAPGLRQSSNFSLQQSVGVGVNVTTPIGPIRLDYGIGRDGGRTDFSIGQSF